MHFINSKSTENKISLLIDGPGRGHNSSLILNELNKSDKFHSIFITENYAFKGKYNNIHNVDFNHKNKFIRRLKLLIKIRLLPKVDILYILGGSSIYNLLIIVIFGKYKKIVFNIWSEYVTYDLNKKNFKGYCYRFIFRRTSKILCNWYGTYNLINSKMPELKTKTIVMPWGLDETFLFKQPIISKYVDEFIKTIPLNRIVLLNMRSISDYNNIETLLESLLLLKQTNGTLFDQLLLIFWPGNNVNLEKEEFIYSYIVQNNLHDHIWYVKHPFVPTSDIRHIIERADIIVNLVKHDQLSTSVIEAMYLKKELICSNIKPYQILNDTFKTHVDLLENSHITLSEMIKTLSVNIKNQQQNNELLEYRSQIIQENFKMSNYLLNVYPILADLIN